MSVQSQTTSDMDAIKCSKRFKSMENAKVLIVKVQVKAISIEEKK